MPTPMDNAEHLLEMRGIQKSFPGVKALEAVDFTLRRGEIHALMGENGAGKSTLIKVLTGVYRKDRGEVLFENRHFEVDSPLEASLRGISTVYQEINLLHNLSVAENIFIGRQPVKMGVIDWATMNARAEESLERLDIHIDVTKKLSEFSVAIQQMVAIARALDIKAKILILDEPTSSLDTAECDRLFSVMELLRDQGIGIIFITHFLDQVYATSDRITVLRNGRLIGDYQTKTLPRMELISKMLGKELHELQLENETGIPERGKTFDGAFVSIQGMERRGSVEAFDLSVGTGEVVGLAGLLGSGRTEMVRLIFGIDRAHKGKIFIDGKEAVIASPRAAISHHMGFCPEDRKDEGIIPDLSVRENITLALRAREGIWKSLSRKKETEIAEEFIRALSIKTPGPEVPAGTLSGGNQQKVVIARWLAMNPQFLLLDEPTRGIDVGAKSEIQKLIRNLCEKGVSVLFISSELEEVIRVSDRVAVLRDRKKVAELSGNEINERAIMKIIAQGEKA